MRSYELLPLVTLFAPQTLARLEMPASFEEMADAAPRSFLFNGAELAALRASLPEAKGVLKQGYQELRKRALEALEEPLFTPVDKTELPPGATRNDYVSFAKYWHPDPDTPDGLPYVQRDGDINADIYDPARSDVMRFELFSETVFLLAFTFAISGEAQFGQRAAEQLRSWFLDPETAQTPHFRHAQVVRGHDTGRFVGLIEARRYIYLIDAEGWLSGSPFWSDEDSGAFRAWFIDFFHWLRTGEYAHDAQDKPNNIGMWYDAQSAIYALYLGETQLAEKIVREAVKSRVPQQISEDGSMPHELDRARPYDYVAFNLLAMMALGRAGDAVGFDAWWSEDEDGRSFKRAMDWMLGVLGAEDNSAMVDLAAETAILREQNSALAEQVRALTAQKASLSVQRDTLRREAVSERSAAETLRAELSALQEKFLSMQAMSELMEARTARLAEVEAECELLSARITRLNIRLARIASQDDDRSLIEQKAGSAERQLSLIEQEIAGETRRRQALEAEVEAERSERLRLAEEVRALRASTSWRLTAPVRAVASAFGRSRGPQPSAPGDSAKE